MFNTIIAHFKIIIYHLYFPGRNIMETNIFNLYLQMNITSKKFGNKLNSENGKKEHKRIIFKLGREIVCRTWMLEAVIVITIQSSLFHEYI